MMQSNPVEFILRRQKKNEEFLHSCPLRIVPDQNETIESKSKRYAELAEDFYRNEKWPSGISTYEINSFAQYRIREYHYQLEESTPQVFVLRKINFTCYICLSDLKQEEMVRKLSCHHIYHKNCIDE